MHALLVLLFVEAFWLILFTENAIWCTPSPFFLINFEVESKVQKPSKLIDYGLVQRPILSIKPFDIDKIVLKEFLIGNYEKQTEVDDIEQYNIKNVASDFIDLVKVES